MKIPTTCGECSLLKDEAVCGFYDDRLFVVSTDRKPPQICPKRHVSRFEWLCGNAIQECTLDIPPDGYNLWYELKLPLTYNNDVMATIDDRMGTLEPWTEVDHSHAGTFRIGDQT